MKDKLVKYHHKAIMYYAKKAGICFSIFVGTAIAVAIPVSIAAGMRQGVIDEQQEHVEEEHDDKMPEVQNLVY